jgi:hypothetical protein
MFVHAVYFWLKPELTDAQRSAFDEGVRALATIESVRHAFLGTPATTNRPIIDRTYSRAAIFVFDDLAGHDVYQAHATHDRFRDHSAPLCQRIQIYDSEG